MTAQEARAAIVSRTNKGKYSNDKGAKLTIKFGVPSTTPPSFFPIIFTPNKSLFTSVPYSFQFHFSLSIFITFLPVSSVLVQLQCLHLNRYLLLLQLFQNNANPLHHLSLFSPDHRLDILLFQKSFVRIYFLLFVFLIILHFL